MLQRFPTAHCATRVVLAFALATCFCFLLPQAPLAAAPLSCTPTFSPSTRIDAACPDLGAPILALPDAVYIVSWEDLSFPWLRTGTEPDFQDHRDLVTFNHLADSAIVSFIGADSAIDNILKYQTTNLFSNSNPGAGVTIPVTPGSELILGLQSGSNLWLSGSGFRNWDLASHELTTRVGGDSNPVPTPTPEISTGNAAVIGILAIAVHVGARRRRRIRLERKEVIRIRSDYPEML